MKISKLDAEFENELRQAARECIERYRYRPTYFLSMLAEHGGVVVDCRRPDLTVEYFVAMPKYAPLFEPAEIAKANRWLGR